MFLMFDGDMKGLWFARGGMLLSLYVGVGFMLIFLIAKRRMIVVPNSCYLIRFLGLEDDTGDLISVSMD